jgi:hypothetical protein
MCFILFVQFSQHFGLTLMILRCMVRKIAPQSMWHQRVEALFEKYPDVSRAAMGFFEGWENHPLWKQ